MRFITLVEYCKQYNINLKTAQRAAKEGRIGGAVKPGRDWEVPASCTWRPGPGGRPITTRAGINRKDRQKADDQK